MRHGKPEYRPAQDLECARQNIERAHAGAERAERFAHGGNQEREIEPAEARQHDDANHGQQFRPREDMAESGRGGRQMAELVVGGLAHVLIVHSASGRTAVSEAGSMVSGPAPLMLVR